MLQRGSTERFEHPQLQPQRGNVSSQQSIPGQLRITWLKHLTAFSRWVLSSPGTCRTNPWAEQMHWSGIRKHKAQMAAVWEAVTVREALVAGHCHLPEGVWSQLGRLCSAGQTVRNCEFQVEMQILKCSPSLWPVLPSWLWQEFASSALKMKFVTGSCLSVSLLLLLIFNVSGGKVALQQH